MKIGTRVKILPSEDHFHAEKTGTIIGDEEARQVQPDYPFIYSKEFWVKFDNQNNRIKARPFHPSEFEVIE